MTLPAHTTTLDVKQDGAFPTEGIQAVLDLANRIAQADGQPMQIAPETAALIRDLCEPLLQNSLPGADLQNEILNLACEHLETKLTLGEQHAFKLGHSDACHAAAELVCAHLAKAA